MRGVGMSKKSKDALDEDLRDETEKSDSLPSRIELLLIQILRELQKIKDK